MNVSIANIKSGLTGWTRYLNQFLYMLCENLYPHDSKGNVIDLGGDFGSDTIRFSELNCINLNINKIARLQDHQLTSVDLSNNEMLVYNSTSKPTISITTDGTPFILSLEVSGSFDVANLSFNSQSVVTRMFLYGIIVVDGADDQFKAGDSTTYCGNPRAKSTVVCLPAGTYTIYCNCYTSSSVNYKILAYKPI